MGSSNPRVTSNTFKKFLEHRITMVGNLIRTTLVIYHHVYHLLIFVAKLSKGIRDYPFPTYKGVICRQMDKHKIRHSSINTGIPTAANIEVLGKQSEILVRNGWQPSMRLLEWWVRQSNKYLELRNVVFRKPFIH